MIHHLSSPRFIELQIHQRKGEMANINNKEEPSTAPQPDRWYNLTLGSSFKDHHPSSKFCTLRCKSFSISIYKYMYMQVLCVRFVLFDRCLIDFISDFVIPLSSIYIITYYRETKRKLNASKEFTFSPYFGF